MTLDIESIASQISLFDASRLMLMVQDRYSDPQDAKRFGIHPIMNENAFRRAKIMEGRLWNATRLDFTKDTDEFKSFSATLQKPLKYVFGFFAVGDGGVSEAVLYFLLFCSLTLEERMFYIHQLQNELVHAETYGNMIMECITDPEERKEIQNMIQSVKGIKKMNDFIRKKLYAAKDYKTLYITLVYVEFLFFTPLFCVIYWYKHHHPGKIKRIIESNEHIASDEALHCRNGIELYNSKGDRFTDQEIADITHEAVACIDELIEEIYDDISLEGITTDLVKQYVRFTADTLCIELKHKPIYNVSSPFSWMGYINFVAKTNFYEGDVAEYSQIDVKKAVDYAKKMATAILNDEKVAKTEEEDDFF